MREEVPSQQLVQDPPPQEAETKTETKTGNITESVGVAVGTGATAVYVDALGDVGDVVTGTKLNIINQTASERVASQRQIAAPPDDYIARPTVEKELKEMLTVSDQGFRIIYLYGLPGMGKTWLVRKVTKELEDHFVDGTLWADLEKTKLRTAVWHFIEPYDQTINHNSLKSNSEYVAAMEEAFGEKRILIVLDQLDQSRKGPKKWLPNNCPNCVVLLVSQQPPPVLQENESSYQLSGMSEDETLQMFSHLLQASDGSETYDEDSFKALAKKLDYIPAAINTVARDISVRLITPGDYLNLLSSRRDDSGERSHLPGLEAVFENLPEDGKTLFPFLGILHSVPWTADDLFAVSRKSSREIEVGLTQLERAGLVDKRVDGRYQTPSTISDFAFDQLVEIGGQELINATTQLQASNILRKAEQVLRYVRQAMLKQCWRDEENRKLLIQSITKQFSSPLPEVDRKSKESSMLAVPRDPLLDFFENAILKKQENIIRWQNMLEAANFPMLRHQLEEVFNWAYEQEDWPLLRRFATNINVNSEWIIGKSLIGKKQERNRVQFNFAFPLLKDFVVENYELLNVVLKAPNIKTTVWDSCQFIATEWLGAYVMSSAFSDIDMVGMKMPGGVITGCKYINVDARYGDFRGTIFQKCTFSEVNFRGAKFEKAKFIDCYFENVDFRLTHLEDAFARFL